MTVALGLLWPPSKAAHFGSAAQHICSTTAAAVSIQVGWPFVEVNLPMFGSTAGLNGTLWDPLSGVVQQKQGVHTLLQH